jgi:hypothetical protein
LRHPKLENLRASFVGDDNRVGTQVGMHKSAAVRFGKRVGDLNREFNDASRIDRSPLTFLTESNARRELVRKVAVTFVFPGIKQGRDVWMRQRHRRACLAEKQRPRRRVGEHLGGNELQRNRSSDLRVARAKELAGRAFTQPLQNVVMSDGGHV